MKLKGSAEHILVVLIIHILYVKATSKESYEYITDDEIDLEASAKDEEGIRLVNATSKESYEYMTDDEIDLEASAKDEEGIRLVNGKKINPQDVPFIVGIDLRARGSTPCTGSLISPKWVITAAHCTELLAERNSYQIKRCLRRGNGRSVKFDGLRFTCRRLMDGSLEYGNLNPKGIAWLGLNSMRGKHKAEQRMIERIIRHRNTYFKGTSYGRNGGYDISLLHLTSPTNRPPACLPSPHFNDNQESKLAGYGRFIRKSCQTDEQGMMKFHYCKQEGSGHEVCRKGKPPQDPKCRNIPKVDPNHLYYTDKHTGNKMAGEVEIIKNGRSVATCFTHSKGNRGWCKTRGNYYDPKNPKRRYNGWGYCSDDCFVYEEANKVGTTGVLRAKEHVDVLPDNLCDFFLEKSLKEGRPKTRPEILCVGLIKNFIKIAYTPEGQLLKGHRARHQFDYFRQGFYVASGGTCNGDSGGPLYLHQGGKYIVTGAVSGGRGELHQCGGINNPAHYVRIKKFGNWIKGIAGNEAKDICFV